MALALLEVGGWSPAMVLLDAMEKTAGVELLQTELNDRPGVCLEFAGELSALTAATEAAGELGRSDATHGTWSFSDPRPGTRIGRARGAGSESIDRTRCVASHVREPPQVEKT